MSDMLTQRRTLVEALYQKTLQGKLEWEEGLAAKSFQTSVGRINLQISKESDEDRTDINLELFDKGWNSIELFSDNSFGGVTPVRVGQSSYFNLMLNLFEMAQRNSSGADKVVAELLDSLEVDLITWKEDNPEDDFPF